MAGEGAPMKKSRSIEGLLMELKKGQEALRKSMTELNPPVSQETQNILDQQRLDKISRESLMKKLDKLADFPRKRARLDQLTLDSEESCSSPEPQPPQGKHPRRLSSTPMATPVAPTPSHALNQNTYPDPSTIDIQSLSSTTSQDDSLKEILLNKKLDIKNPSTIGNCYSLPSPRLSTIAIDSSLDSIASKSSSLRDNNLANIVQKPSSLRDLQRSSKKKRLTVSFMHDDDKPSTSKRKLTRHSTQRNLDESLGKSLVISMNPSCSHASQSSDVACEGKGKRQTSMVAGSDPRLGYDWIAGLLDASGPSLSDRDNEYFNEINEFRKVNYDECHRSKGTELPMLSSHEVLLEQELMEEEKEENSEEVKNYVLNSRLFPEKLPFCPGRKPREDEHDDSIPSSSDYIRVSVPHSILQLSERVRPRLTVKSCCKSDESMGLSQHCQLGYEAAKVSTIPPQTSLNLKSSLSKVQGQAVKDQSKALECGHNLLDTSRLIEYDIRSRSILKKH